MKIEPGPKITLHSQGDEGFYSAFYQESGGHYHMAVGNPFKFPGVTTIGASKPLRYSAAASN